ncbi:Vmc-like lipoprotein signal peptide domain-containing protein [Mycobacterium sp. SMC-16]|uniref:Vmc-like lipoprotein signal peptide domain-containing protein n=1 Tax=Mycobacterium sp. SMC-16 TaxID=3385967 RepID=UPI00390CA7D0
MTQPPTWGAPPPQQPGGWPGQPGPGGQWGPQQPWPAPVPPKKGGAAKWAIGAVSLVAVIAVTAVVAVSCTKNSGDSNGGGGGTQTSAAPADVASANDKGPVGIITEDPSCAPWGPITNTLAGVEGKGWRDRDPSIPASLWTPDARTQYETVGKAWRKAADQIVPLARMTPHRAMRELYEQSIVYMRAYADSISTYKPIDDNLARTAATAGLVITYVCDAISSGSAAARASAVPPQKPPTVVAPVGDPAHPTRMFETADSVCSNLSLTLDQLAQNPAFKSWMTTDPQIPASNWSPEQQSLTEAVIPAMNSMADALEKLTETSSNPVVKDFILLGVQYQRTYVEALSTYQPNDHTLYSAGQGAAAVVRMACNYAAG